MSVEAVILDIEGTVCPISFVKETLFPYFVAKVPELVHSNDPDVKSVLAQFPQQYQGDLGSHMQSLVANDVKDPVLKQLQGQVWAEGYTSGQIKSPLYPDAIEFMQRSSSKLYIYSSGSVQAQKLLFAYVEDPSNPTGPSLNLQPLIKGYFDINTSGKKVESHSYERIVQDIKTAPQQVLFISDNILELKAAQEAGLQTLLAIRPGNATIPDMHGFRTVESFASLQRRNCN
ncbi:probable Enolase-phosphatase E1 [Zygosaccharomyces bailii]|nr:probable Enolase-phosphatase E1 [Zygosaccharomyces bailii]